MKKYTVELTCYVPGQGYSYCTDLDPIINPDVDEYKLARMYASEYELPDDGNDYLFQVYNSKYQLVSEIWSNEL